MGSPDVLQNMTLRAIENVKDLSVIGLGSGSTVAVFIKALAKHVEEKKLGVHVIPTSLQIKLESEVLGFRILDDTFIPSIDIVFDGADQIDARFNMIKGGGGALLKEKVLIHAAKEVVILADESKYVNMLNTAVPVEVHPFARKYVYERLNKWGGSPKIRTNEKGYPFVTENGNVILDTDFGAIDDAVSLEREVKNIAGVMEVGIFTKRATKYYKANKNGSLEVLVPR
ncbi:MAG: ribose-5-phosphate isomerase RpiA [Nitrososphaerales archaeon]